MKAVIQRVSKASVTIEGKKVADDLDYLFYTNFKEADELKPYSNIKDKLEMVNQNQKAIIKSKYSGVVNIRQKCVGIQVIN